MSGFVSLKKHTYLCIGANISFHITREKIQPSFLSSFRTGIQIFSSEISTTQRRIGKQTNIVIVWMTNFNQVNCKNFKCTQLA